MNKEISPKASRIRSALSKNASVLGAIQAFSEGENSEFSKQETNVRTSKY